MRSIKFAVFLGALAAIMISGCKKNEADPSIPLLKLTPVEVTGKSGRTVTATLSVQAPNGAKDIVIYKTVNLQRDNAFGGTGTMTVTPDNVGGNTYEYQFSYQLNGEEVDKLVGFNFHFEDNKGLSAEKDLTVHTTVSGQQIIYSKKWTLKSRTWTSVTPNVEDMKDCEKDNIFSWNSDSTYSVNFGTSACTFDGFNVFDRWELSENEKTFTQVYHSLFDPSSITTETYTVKALASDRLVLEQLIDLTVFGLSDKEVFISTYEPAP